MGIVLVYDCTEEATFNNISNWIKQIDQHASSGVTKVLVANKVDLPNRTVTSERGQQLADEYGLRFFECSAKTGVNINELFFELAKKISAEQPHLTSQKKGHAQSAANHSAGGSASAEQARVKLGQIE